MSFTKLGTLKGITLKNGQDAMVTGPVNLWVMPNRDGGWDLMIADQQRKENRGYQNGELKANKASPERKTWTPNFAPQKTGSASQAPEEPPWPETEYPER